MGNAVDQQTPYADFLHDLLDQIALAAKTLQDSRRRSPDDTQHAGFFERVKIDAVVQGFGIDLPGEFLKCDEQSRLVIPGDALVENPDAQGGFPASRGPFNEQTIPPDDTALEQLIESRYPRRHELGRIAHHRPPPQNGQESRLPARGAWQCGQ